MSGGGVQTGIQNAYSQLPSNLGGTGSYAGQDVAQAPPDFMGDARQAGTSGMARGVSAMLRQMGYEQGRGPFAAEYGNMPGGFFGYGGQQQTQPWQQRSQTPWSSYAPSYGHMGSYNTLAQDLAQGRTGAFGFGGPGGPFQYAPGGDPSGRRGISGYSGVGPFQNQGGGRIPGGFQTSMGYGGWPGFGMGGAPHNTGGFGGYGGGFYGGAYGGGGYGQQGMPFFSGPGSYGSPGAMPFGGGSGFQSGYFDRFSRMQDLAQRPFTPGQRRPGSPTGVTTGHYTGPLNFTTGGPGSPRSVQPAQQVQQYLNYRSPFSGGGKLTQYGPNQDPMANIAGGGVASW